MLAAGARRLPCGCLIRSSSCAAQAVLASPPAASSSRASAQLTAAAAAEQARASDEVRPPASSGAALPPPEERVLGMPANSAVDEVVGVSGAIGPLAFVIISKPAVFKACVSGVLLLPSSSHILRSKP